jgi:hypothetical protein
MTFFVFIFSIVLKVIVGYIVQYSLLSYYLVSAKGTLLGASFARGAKGSPSFLMCVLLGSTVLRGKFGAATANDIPSFADGKYPIKNMIKRT